MATVFNANNNNNHETAATNNSTDATNNSTDATNSNSNKNMIHNHRLHKQSSTEDLLYDKDYNEMTFMPFDDNEEYNNSIYSTSSSLNLTKLTPSHHIKQAEDALFKIKLVVDQPGWKKLLTHRNGVVVYGKSGATNDDKLPVFMGEHVIRGYTPQSIFAVIGTRKLWDDWYEEGNLVENLNETTSLTYMVIQALAGSKARDLSLVEKIECTLEGKIYFVSTSVNSQKIPHVSNRIRAHIHLNGWILEPLSYNPPVTKVSYVLQTNVKGWIPSVVAKKYLTRRPLVINTIETYLRKNGPPTMFINNTDNHSVSSPSHSHAPSISSSINYHLSPKSYTHKDGDGGSKKSSGQHNTIGSLSSLNDAINNIVNGSDNENDNINKNDVNNTNYINDNDNKITSPTPTDNIKPEVHTKSILVPSKPILVPSKPILVPSKPILVASTPATSTPITPLTPITNQMPSIKFSKKIDSKVLEKDRTKHRHSKTLRVAMDNFKSQARSLNGWELHSDSKGLKIYTKNVDGKPTPIMRGESRITGGFTAEDILSIISNIEMRKIWDERFEECVVLEKLNHSDILVKTMMKGTFPISGRDLSLVSSDAHDPETGIIRFISTSVTDPLIPETRKHVRAYLKFAGFELVPEFDDNGFTKHVDIKYIVDIDIKLDTIPASILKQVSIQTPMVLAKIDELLQKSGFPPYIRESTSQTSMKSCLLNTKTFECDIEVVGIFGNAVTELKTSRTMYPNGPELTIQPGTVNVELLPNKVDVVRIRFPSKVNDSKNVLKIKIKKSTSKKTQVTYNGGKSIPLAASPSSSPSSSSSTLLSESNDQNSGIISESINQNIISTSIHPNLKTPSPSKSITSSKHHQESSEIRLKNYNNNNNNNKENKEIEKQIFKHLTKTTTTVGEGGEDLKRISINNNINNLNDHFASFAESFRFNSQQVGLMFASMLLAYYAGKLSG